MSLQKFLKLFKKKEKVKPLDKLGALALMMEHEMMYEKFMENIRKKHGIVLTPEQRLQEMRENAAARAESTRIILKG